MSESKVHLETIVRFRDGLAKAVELGYGQDECGHAVAVMFEDMIRRLKPKVDAKTEPLVGPRNSRSEPSTCEELLAQATTVVKYAEQSLGVVTGKKQRTPVIFPFLTTLGVSGGLFLLAFHIARLA